MAKHRIFIVFSILFFMFIVLSFSSPIFCISQAMVVFVDANNKVNDASNDKVSFFNKTNIEKNAKLIIKEDIGKTIFDLNKEKYYKKFEFQNSYAKLLRVESKYPNTVVFYVSERKPVFVAQNIEENGILILDSEFKIVEKNNNNSDIETYKLINFFGVINNKKVSIFSFFEINFDAFTVGMNLKENNLAISAISNIATISKKINVLCQDDLANIFLELNFYCDEKSLLNLNIMTNENCLGVKLSIENVLSNFDKKFEKLILALNTLYKKDRIKTTYGELKINDALNCFWNKL